MQNDNLHVIANGSGSSGLLYSYLGSLRQAAVWYPDLPALGWGWRHVPNPTRQSWFVVQGPWVVRRLSSRLHLDRTLVEGHIQ